MGRKFTNCYNILVFNNPPEYEHDASELSRVEQQLCYRAVEAYMGATKKGSTPERSILFTGVHSGNLDEDGNIERENSSMAAFVLEQFPSIPEGDVLIGVETTNLRKNLAECAAKHLRFTERIEDENQTLGVIAYADQMERVAKSSAGAFGAYERQVIKLPIYQVASDMIKVTPEVETVEEELAMAADT